MSAPESEFPIEVKTGRVVVKVYDTPKVKDGKTYPVFTIDAGVVNGKRERYQRSDLKDAIKKAEDVGKKIANGEIATLKLSAADVEMLSRCKKLIEPLGKTLETICTEYVQAMQVLGNFNLNEAVRFFVEKNVSGIVPKTIAELIEPLCQSKENENLDKKHIKSLRVRLKRAARHFTCSIHKLTYGDINTWISGLRNERTGVPLSPQSKLHYRAALSTLLNSAIAKPHLPRNWDVNFNGKNSDIMRPKVIRSKVVIYTPEQFTTLLYAAAGALALPLEGVEGMKAPSDEEKKQLRSIVPYLAIGAFGATRNSTDDGEITELDWTDIDFATNQIDMDDGAGKVGDRYIPIQPNLRAWLLPYAKKDGPIVPKKTDEIRKLLCRLTGIKWIPNGLRKSFISYRIAQIGDAGKVASEAGNSPGQIYGRYRKAIPKELGDRWFNIYPPATASNVLDMPPHEKAA